MLCPTMLWSSSNSIEFKVFFINTAGIVSKNADSPWFGAINLLSRCYFKSRNEGRKEISNLTNKLISSAQSSLALSPWKIIQSYVVRLFETRHNKRQFRKIGEQLQRWNKNNYCDLPIRRCLWHDVLILPLNYWESRFWKVQLPK